MCSVRECNVERSGSRWKCHVGHPTQETYKRSNIEINYAQKICFWFCKKMLYSNDVHHALQDVVPETVRHHCETEKGKTKYSTQYYWFWNVLCWICCMKKCCTWFVEESAVGRRSCCHPTQQAPQRRSWHDQARRRLPNTFQPVTKSYNTTKNFLRSSCLR